MAIRRVLTLIALFPVLWLTSSGSGHPPKGQASLWHVAGTLHEACSCSVPCTCNFGESPSPYPFCYSMYSYRVRQGNYGPVKLDGLKFGSVDAEHGRVMYIDREADPAQRQALLAIAEDVLALRTTRQFFEGQSMTHIATRYVDIIQQESETANYLKLGDDGEFRANYIVGRDGKTPVTVRNNTTWNIAEAIKGKTTAFEYRFGRNRFSFKNTNSNQGEFDYDSSSYAGGRPIGEHCGR